MCCCCDYFHSSTCKSIRFTCMRLVPAYHAVPTASPPLLASLFLDMFPSSTKSCGTVRLARHAPSSNEGEHAYLEHGRVGVMSRLAVKHQSRDGCHKQRQAIEKDKDAKTERRDDVESGAWLLNDCRIACRVCMEVANTCIWQHGRKHNVLVEIHNMLYISGEQASGKINKK